MVSWRWFVFSSSELLIKFSRADNLLSRTRNFVAFNFRECIEGVCHGAAGAVSFAVAVFQQILPGHLCFHSIFAWLSRKGYGDLHRSQNLKACRFTGALERKE